MAEENIENASAALQDVEMSFADQSDDVHATDSVGYPVLLIIVS